MPDFTAIIKSNPILLIACIIVVIMMLIALIKRILPLFIMAVLIVAAYAGYLAFTGQDVPTNSDEIIEHGRKKIEDVKKSIIRGQRENVLNEVTK